MNNLHRLSRIFHFLLIVCFLLPFIPKGCSISKKELAEKALADSLRIADSISSFQRQKDDTIKRSSSNVLLTSNKPPKTLLTDEIINRANILKPILRPNEGYSGVGLMVDSYSRTFLFYTLYLSFILAIFTLILSFYYQRNLHVVLFISTVIGFMCFVLFKFSIYPLSGWLWGYKTAFIFWVITIFLDFFIFLRNRRLKVNISLKKY